MATSTAGSRSRRMLAPTAMLTGVATTTAALAVRDPHVQGSWGFCPFLAVTGAYCPGCGVLRAVNDLAHGNVLDAASSNLYFVALLPVVAAAWLVWTADRWHGRERLLSRRAFQHVVAPSLCVLLVVLTAFAVLRNTDVGAWLAP